MPQQNQSIRVEIKEREWVEFHFETDPATGVIKKSSVKAQGCLPLLEAVQKAALGFQGQKLNDIAWNKNSDHWDQLILEALSRLQGMYERPYKDEEMCHCRKITTDKIEAAIVLGAHTPEKVKAWTTAGSGCGTCRPNVQSLIDFRVQNKCRK